LSTLIAVVAALADSVVFGMSSVAEQRGTKRVPRRRALSPGAMDSCGGVQTAS